MPWAAAKGARATNGSISTFTATRSSPISPPAGLDRTSNHVDGHGVPVPHFGIVLAMEDWQDLADRLTAAGVEFAIEPTIRFRGQPGEQATMFFRDPSGNALEMKAFADDAMLFAT